MSFFFNDTATTEIYTLSLHDALPISTKGPRLTGELSFAGRYLVLIPFGDKVSVSSKIKSGEERARLKRSEEHTSELQSRQYLVCRLLLEKKKPIQLTYA